MKYHAPSRCPVCSSAMFVTRLHCDKCSAELTGSFTPCRFCSLEEKHLSFVETFLRCRGNIKEVEKALNVSYPTVRNMMDQALQALGYQPDVQDSVEYDGKKKDRESILEKLENREISAADALDALNKL